MESGSSAETAAVTRAGAVVSSWAARHKWGPLALVRVDYDEQSVMIYATEPLPDDARTELATKIAPVQLVEVQSAYNSWQLRRAAKRLLEAAPKEGPYVVTMAGPDRDGNGLRVWPCYPVTDEAEFRRHLHSDLPIVIDEAVGRVNATPPEINS